MKNKKNSITIIVGTIIMLAGILLVALNIASEKIIQGGVITIGMIMIVIGVVNTIKKKEGVAKDELTRKIADRAAAYSWVITLIALLLIFWMNHFEIIKFSINGIISIIYVIMVATMIYYQKKYWKKGDVK
jgi:peptidoglycan/LPS O-acetylase OafA/YrhL